MERSGHARRLTKALETHLVAPHVIEFHAAVKECVCSDSLPIVEPARVGESFPGPWETTKLVGGGIQWSRLL